MRALLTHHKKLKLLGDLGDSKSGARKIQEKPGISHWSQKRRIFKESQGRLEGPRASLAQSWIIGYHQTNVENYNPLNKIRIPESTPIGTHTEINK